MNHLQNKTYHIMSITKHKRSPPVDFGQQPTGQRAQPQQGRSGTIP